MFCISFQRAMDSGLMQPKTYLCRVERQGQCVTRQGPACKRTFRLRLWLILTNPSNHVEAPGMRYEGHAASRQAWHSGHRLRLRSFCNATCTHCLQHKDCYALKYTVRLSALRFLAISRVPHLVLLCTDARLYHRLVFSIYSGNAAIKYPRKAKASRLECQSLA